MLCYFAASLPGQNQAAKWYYANGAGLDFMTNPPSPITGSMAAYFSCASIADAAGNLLFYTNGSSIWNQQHQVMSGGTGLNGNSRQSVLIVPQPGSSTIYYVFTCNSVTGGLFYTTVDMSLGAGLGAVTSLTVPLISNNTLVGKVAGTAHCSGNAFWVVAETGSAPARSFYAFLVTASGVNVTPTVSPGYSVSLGSSAGQMHFSSRGNKLGMVSGIQANYSPLAPVSGNLFHVWDFDAATGVVSNSLALGISYWNNPVLVGAAASGCEFSPNGSKFYGSVARYSNINNLDQSAILQWDLCAGSSTAIAASEYTANNASYNGIAPYDQGDLQLAPNGKIYVMRENMTAIDVIGNPDNAGAGCNYQLGAQSTGTLLTGFCLPNVLSSYLQPTFGISPFTQTVSCLSASFSAPPVPILACAAVGPTVGLLWNFGEPASGAANTSTNSNPVHNYAVPGTYTVQLSFIAGCATRSIALPVTISPAMLSFSSSSITCAALGSATASPLGGIGPFSYSWIPGGQNGPTASGLIPGTYSVAFSDQGTGCAYTATINFPPLVPLTGQVNNSPSIPCSGVGTGTADITLYGSSGSSYYYWNNGLTVQTTPSVSNLAGGLHTVTVVDALTSCSVTQSFFINQPPAFSLLLGSSSPSVCAGGSVTLSVSGSGGTPAAGYTYTWSNGAPAGSIVVSQAVAGIYNYSVNGNDGNGCAAAGSMSVSFIPNPTVSVTDVSICPNQSGTLSAGGAASYSWQPQAIVSASLVDSPAASSSYTVTGEALGCLSSPVSANIVVMAAPAASIAAVNPVCQGQVLSFTASTGSVFAWSGPAAFSSGLQSPVIAQALPANGGVYTLTLTASNGCTAQASLVQTVIPTPTLLAQGSTVCVGATLTFSVNSAANSTFSWTGPAAINSTQQNLQIANAGIPQSGTYSVVMTSVEGCTASAIANALVVPPPPLSLSLSSSSFCAQALSGSPNSMTLTAGGAASYTLSTPNHIYNPNPAGPSSPLSLSPPYLNTGPATATLTGSNGVCTASLLASFSIVPNPTLSALSPSPVICAGQSYTYTSNGAASYTWSASSPGAFTYTSGDVAVANPSVNAVFSVVGGSLGCYSALQSSTITVNTLPVVALGGHPVICPNSSTSLTASGSATAYSWTPSLALSAATGNTVSVSPAQLQSYTVTGSLNSCTSSAVITVSVLPLPAASFSASSYALCLNDAIMLTGSGGETYLWRIPGGVQLSGQQAQFQAANLNQSGTFTLTVTDQRGCRNSATANISIKALPNATLSGPLQGCVPWCARLELLGSSSITGQWSFNQQNLGSSTFQYCFQSPGTYTVSNRLYDSGTGCSAVKQYQLSVYPKPVAAFEFSPATPVESLDEVLFTSNSSDAIALSWHLHTPEQVESSGSDLRYTFKAPGLWPVALVVSNQWTCSDTLVKAIQVEPLFNLYVPNAFSPNGDALNDIFYPVGSGVVDYHLLIYDRWGQLVFESHSLQQGWDGSFNGEPAKTDSYAWKIRATNSSGKSMERQGHVNLLR